MEIKAAEELWIQQQLREILVEFMQLMRQWYTCFNTCF
jgi:hypothetical protein